MAQIFFRAFELLEERSSRAIPAFAGKTSRALLARRKLVSRGFRSYFHLQIPCHCSTKVLLTVLLKTSSAFLLVKQGIQRDGGANESLIPRE